MILSLSGLEQLLCIGSITITLPRLQLKLLFYFKRSITITQRSKRILHMQALDLQPGFATHIKDHQTPWLYNLLYINTVRQHSLIATILLLSCNCN